MSALEQSFLPYAISRLHFYKDLGDKTLAQLDEDDLHYTPNGDTNSIAVIVQHMNGNMMSRFTNFLTEDGEKPWRKRDAEFEATHLPKEKILSLWEEAWQCAMTTLHALQPADLLTTVYIRTEPLPAFDAILRQLAHCSYHVGQMIWIAKLRKSGRWQPLSIAKGQSHTYNEQLAKQFDTK